MYNLPRKVFGSTFKNESSAQTFLGDYTLFTYLQLLNFKLIQIITNKLMM